MFGATAAAGKRSTTVAVSPGMSVPMLCGNVLVVALPFSLALSSMKLAAYKG
jgi:hypothetical protein